MKWHKRVRIKPILFLMILIMAVSVYGVCRTYYQINTFQNGNSQANLTANLSGQNSINVLISNGMNITTASINISGLTSYSKFHNLTEIGYSVFGKNGSNSRGNFSNLTDLDIFSFIYREPSVIPYNETFNFTLKLPEQNKAVKLQYYVYLAGSGAPNPYSSSVEFKAMNKSGDFNIISASTSNFLAVHQNIFEVLNFTSDKYTQDYVNISLQLSILHQDSWIAIGGLWDDTIDLSRQKLQFISEDYPTNLTLYFDNNQIYKNESRINTTIAVLINTTQVQNCLQNCSSPTGDSCVCAFRTETNRNATVQLSHLEITNFVGENPTLNLVFDKATDVHLRSETGENVSNFTGILAMGIELCNYEKGYMTLDLKQTSQTQYLQKYEFINDYETSYSDNVYMLNNPSVHRYIREMSSALGRLPDVTVRVEQSNYSWYGDLWYNNKKSKLTSRLVTDENGYADFWIDPDYYYNLIESKDGYSTTKPLNEQLNYSNTLETASIRILKSGADFEYPFELRIPYQIVNKSYDVLATINYKPQSTIKYKTTYMSQNKTATNNYVYTLIDTIKDILTVAPVDTLYRVHLVAGSDFIEDNSNITIFFWADDTLMLNWTIEYIGNRFEKTNDYGSVSLTKKIINPLLLFGLVMFVVIARIFFQSSVNDVGKHVFLFGLICLTFISPDFWIAGVVSGTHYVLKSVRPLIGVGG